MLIWLLISIPRLNGPIDLRWDASTYFILGTSLAEGKGYRLLNEPGEIRAVQYPPLLPLLVAVTQRSMGTSDFFAVGSRLRLIYFLLSGAYLLAAYVLARQLLAPTYALLVTAITGLSFNGFFYPSDSLYAELPFALISILFLLSVRRSNRPAWGVASGLLGIAAYLLRTAGIALLVAWVAESLFRRRFIEAAGRAAVAAVPVLAWQAYVWGITQSEEYHRPAYSYQRAPYYYSNVSYAENSLLVDPFLPEAGRTGAGDLFGRVARNAMVIPLGLGESSWLDREFGLSLWAIAHRKLGIPLEYHWRPRVGFVLYLCLACAGLLALAGGLVIATGRDWFLSLYFASTLGLVALTPWQSQFWRYLAPLAPLTLIFLTTAMFAIRRWLFPGAGRWRTLGAMLPIVSLVGMLLVQIPIAVIFLRDLYPVSYYDASGRERLLGLLTYEPQWHALDKAFEWVRQNAPSAAIVATSVPHLAFLRTGHQAVLPPLEPDSGKASRLLDQVPVSYLVLDEFRRPLIAKRYAAPVVAHRPQDWRLVFNTQSGTEVYERVR